MRAPRSVVVTLFVAAAFASACGSFTAAPAPDAAAPDAAASDGTAPDGGGCPDLLCESFEDPDWLTKWSTQVLPAELSRVAEVEARTGGHVLRLELSPKAPFQVVQYALPEKFTRAVLRVHMRVRTRGDGELDLLALGPEGLGAPGMEKAFALIHSSDAFAIEHPGGNLPCNARFDKWQEVVITVTPAGEETKVKFDVPGGGVATEAPVPSSWGTPIRFMLGLGATWSDRSRNRPWRVDYDDVTIAITP